ncbi:MAG: beta-ketoacyl synthase N-terminal-like domain-containing protein [Polyangiaceae bacterium]
MTVLRELHGAADPALPLDWSPKVVHGGRAGLFAALSAAMTALASGKVRMALAGGLDSSCDTASLRHLAAEKRVLGKENPDGLVPGEGAGFLLLAHKDAVSGLGPPLGRLVACATARDDRPFRDRRPLEATALTSVFRQLRQAGAARPRPQHLFSCQTGEGFWSRELSTAYLRNAELMPEPFRVTLVAASLGDAGAASPAIQIAMALHAFVPRRRTAPPLTRALVYGSADNGLTGACAVESAR